MTETPSKPRRRFPRFSLRTMLLLVVVIGAALGGTMHVARQQGRAVAALEKLGCHINFATQESPTILESLRGLLGDDRPRSVTQAYFAGTQVTDAGANELKSALPNLKIVR